MAIVQVLIVTILAEAVVFALCKDETPSALFKKWLTIGVYLDVFVLSRTGMFSLVGVNIFSYADWVFTAVICSVGVDGVKSIIANIVSAQQQKSGGQA
jgi:hypothetical protein